MLNKIQIQIHKIPTYIHIALDNKDLIVCTTVLALKTLMVLLLCLEFWQMNVRDKDLLLVFINQMKYLYFSDHFR